MQKKRKCRSLIQTSIVSMVLYTIVIVSLILSASTLVSNHINRSFPNMSDILTHDKKLKNELYVDLPNHILDHGKLLIYDEANQVIFTNDKDAEKTLKNVPLDFIPSYEYLQYYNVSTTENNEDYYWIIERIEYSPTTDQYLETGICYLDKFYRVVDGNIFTEKAVLSEKELRIMQGTFNEDEMIEKHSFVTNKGMTRTLVYISKNLQYSQYEKVVQEANIIWLYIGGMVIFLLFAAVLLGSRFVKKGIRPLQNAMSAYAKGEAYDLNAHQVPVEYENVVITFNNLVQSLEASQNEKQRMLADISHDLRTPLTVIKGYSQAFMDDIVSEDKAKQYMEVIHQKADLCSKLIDTLIIYTKLDHPDYVLNKIELDLSVLCLNYLAQKYQELEINNMSLDVDIPEENIFFHCDEEMMIRLFDNLISNAIKYAGADTELIFYLRKERNQIVIKIADTGKGIPSEIRQNLFDAFIVADETRKSGKGIGLGLSITKKIVELHGGNISLSEKPEREVGTEFIIKFNL